MVTMDPVVLRPIKGEDFEPFKTLVESIKDSLTSLPNDKQFLLGKIHDSERSFDPTIRKPGGEHYLFGLEHLETGKIIGTCGMIARIGGYDPFYSYEIRKERHEYSPMGISNDFEVLHPKKDHKGPSEIGSLYLDENYRRSGYGRLLSLGRFHFMKAFPERFASHVIAELRGFINAEGISPFWEAVGRPFFSSDFQYADFLSGLGEKEFIHALLPKYPIYKILLSEEAREVVGRVHRNTEPALRILKREGFSVTSEVDIFDAGPILGAEISSLKTVKTCQRGVVQEWLGENAKASQECLISNGKIEFRACCGQCEKIAEGFVRLHTSVAKSLQVTKGDEVLFSPV